MCVCMCALVIAQMYRLRATHLSRCAVWHALWCAAEAEAEAEADVELDVDVAVVV